MIVKSSREVYLDANATTPVMPDAAKEAFEAMQELYGNPSSSHISGLRARSILESARKLARQVLGAHAGQIVFTSGATEAIQMGVFSTLCDVRERRQHGDRPTENRTLLYSATEHKAVPQAIRHWNRLLGVDNDVLEIPVDERGQVDLDFLRQHAANADLICTMAVNNETGVISDLNAIEAAIRQSNEKVSWLVDCVQAVGKLKLDLSETSIDYAPLSGHKIYAPKGIGLLYVGENAPLVPLLAGGGQEQGARAGTENLPGVAAIAAVMRRLAASSSRAFNDDHCLEKYRDRIVEYLKRAFPSIVFNTPFDMSVPTTINFSVKGFSNKELLDLFDAAGIRVSSGSACGSAVQSSYVLEAMGLPQWRCDGSIRLSFGPLASEQDIDVACRRIEQAGQALCESCLVVSSDVGGISGQDLDGLIQLKNGSNCTWLLMDAETKNCVIIDPFEDQADRVELLVGCQKSKILAILDTHAHVDHDSCRKLLLEVLHQQAATTAQTNDLLGWPTSSPGKAILDDGSECPYLTFSQELVIAQIDLPGHTKIGRAFLVGSLASGDRLTAENIRFAFTGDTILMGGIGRTDFPTSSIECMYQSLRRLARIISPQTIICPTHDYRNDFATTLACECRDNDFLKQLIHANSPMPVEQFLAIKPEVDARISDETNSELVCGLVNALDADEVASIELHKEELKSFFQDHRNSLIVDVREPHEFAFEQDWSMLGFENPPANIPLTRLVGYLPELLAKQQSASQDIIFLCRSGKRSGKAAEIARRFGFVNARHIAGGIALNVDQRCSDDMPVEPGYVI